MNYIVNIRTRDIIVIGIFLAVLAYQAEHKIDKFYKKAKKEKDKIDKIIHDCVICDEKDYIYCPICGKKIKED